MVEVENEECEPVGSSCAYGGTRLDKSSSAVREKHHRFFLIVDCSPLVAALCDLYGSTKCSKDLRATLRQSPSILPPRRTLAQLGYVTDTTKATHTLPKHSESRFANWRLFRFGAAHRAQSELVTSARSTGNTQMDREKKNSAYVFRLGDFI